MTAIGWTPPGYTELRELGAGGGGRVVLARHDGSGTHVAVKYLSERLREEPGFLAGFREEARLLVELADENVARLYEYVETSRGAAIVMEAVDGACLRAILREHGPTGPEAALVVLRGSLLGLAAAHEAGLVHRDYKPENVLVRPDGVSRLVDFGIAVRAGEGARAAGTPPYMAPEQWTGAPASPASDVYAATAVFFECLTGHRPYRSAERVVLMHRHLTAPVPVHEVPEPVRELLARGMAKDPRERPPGARAFVAELERVALAGYGEEWEERGRSRLAALVALFPALLPAVSSALSSALSPPLSPTPPPAPTPAGAALSAPSAGTTLFRTVLRSLRPTSTGLALGAAGVALVAGGAGVYALTSDRQARPGEVVSAAAPPAPPASSSPLARGHLLPSPTAGGPASGEPALPASTAAPAGSPVPLGPTGATSSAGPIPSAGPASPGAPAPPGAPTAPPPPSPPAPPPSSPPGSTPGSTSSLPPTPAPTPAPTLTATPAVPGSSKGRVRRVQVLRATLDPRGLASIAVSVRAEDTRAVRLRVVVRAGRAVHGTVVPLSGATDYTPTVVLALPRPACGTAWSATVTGLPSGVTSGASGTVPACARPARTPRPAPVTSAAPPPAPRPVPEPAATRASRPAPGTAVTGTARPAVEARSTARPRVTADARPSPVTSTVSSPRAGS